MINTMRLKYLYTILLLCCVNICFAQNKLFDKYADMDDVTSVYISKKMFQMMPVMEPAASDRWIASVSPSSRGAPGVVMCSESSGWLGWMTVTHR